MTIAITEMLLPTIGAGKKMVLDHASFQRCKLVRKVVEAAGRELIYLTEILSWFIVISNKFATFAFYLQTLSWKGIQ